METHLKLCLFVINLSRLASHNSTDLGNPCLQMLNNGVLDLHLGSYGLKRVGHFDECGGLCYDQGVFK